MASVRTNAAPGVSIVETQSVTHGVVGATTNLTAVLGVFDQGPANEAVLVGSWDEFEAQFGGLNGTMASYAVWQFFHNNGIGAWIVRLTLEDAADTATVGAGAIELTDRATGATGWAAQLTSPSEGNYTLTVTGPDGAVESVPELTGSAGAVATAIQTASKLVNASAVAGATLAVDPNPVPFAGNDVAAQATVGALTFTGASPGSFMNGWTVSLTPAGAAPGQAATHVTVTLTDPATTPPTTVEVLPNLPLDGLADLISSKSSFLRATAVTPAPAPVPVPPAESAPTALPFGGGVTPNLVTGVAGQQATVMLPGGPQLTALAKSETQNSWQAALAADPDNTGRLELTIAAGPAPATTIETLSNLPTDPQALAIAITSQSAQVMVALSAPLEGGADAPWSETTFTQAVLTELGYSTEPGPPPVPPLDQIAPNHFNLMCIPDAAWLQLGNQTAIFSTALQFCTDRQAFLLVDPPPPVTAPVPDRLGGAAPWLQIEQGIGANPADQQKLLAQWAPQFIGPNSYAAAAYYPWVEIPDPNNNFLPIAVPPSGTIAGVYASTDVSRGVWKAPAGVAATLVGVTQLADVSINDDVDGQLNSLGINCLRTFPLYQRVAWGSRTLAGSDLIDTAFKYVPARRLADYIELSLQQSLLWAVFEPNEETLWSSIVAEIMPFMMGLYGSGAFMGATAAQAFSVACDATTTTPADMLAGVVNVQIGFQPVDPAEFVVLNVKVGALSTPAT